MDNAAEYHPQPEIPFTDLVAENQHTCQRAVGTTRQRQPQQNAFGGAPAVCLGLEFIDAKRGEGDEREREVDVE